MVASCLCHDPRDSQSQIQDHQMLVCPIHKPLVDFGEDHNNLALLLVEDDIVVENLLIELQ